MVCAFVKTSGGEGHPLPGHRMPDLDLVTADGPLRVCTLLHQARPVPLNLGESGRFDITPGADRIQLIDARCVGLWELPVFGAVTARRRADPARRICRLGGHVTQQDLPDALTTWFGPPTPTG
jgi:3-(3-hydroxy-phenyl)propionate hydroxylase